MSTRRVMAVLAVVMVRSPFVMVRCGAILRRTVPMTALTMALWVLVQHPMTGEKPIP